MCSLLPEPEVSSHPVDVGRRSEAAILLELLKRGYSCLVPAGENQRYDLVVDDGGDFVRIQCKTGRLQNGVISFPTCSVRTNTRRVIRRDYEGEIDLFAVYCPELDKVYLVPARGLQTNMTLRLAPTANGQAKGVHWARDYELGAERVSLAGETKSRRSDSNRRPALYKSAALTN
jgi:hypothetical protein